MRRAKILLVVALGLIVIASTYSYGHGGGLDKNGGHRNSKTGQYHQHRSPSQPRTSYRAVQSDRPDYTAKIGEYFRAANQGALYWDGAKVKRDVSGSQRNRVLARDGHACVICGSSSDLEVDHRRALSNGGDNSLSNLATLCHDCHAVKTKMDGSLRRKRER